MKQRSLVLIGLLGLIALLVGLNAASYTQKEKTPDSEAHPNRSTYNSGATGTQAIYSLLAETGRRVVRWQEPPAQLLTSKNKPAVFVVVGSVRQEFTDEDVEHLMQWVALGGHLIVVDREPVDGLATTTSNWRVDFRRNGEFGVTGVDPTDEAQMTKDTPAAKPVQPTLITQGVNAIQASRFASDIEIATLGEPFSGTSPTPGHEPYQTMDDTSALQTAPVVHFAARGTNLLADVPYGQGRITYLSDPYVISNAGIQLADNVQAAVNLFSVRDGSVAFDEYHQGYGTDRNAFLKFFEGTPVVALFFQAVLLVGLVFYSQSRRFARAVPEPQPDRLSKLEYVSAMAELQHRVRAYDLAIENVYTDLRRRAAALLGADNLMTRHDELARLIAGRTGLDARAMAQTFFKCEEIMHGEPTDRREVVALIGQLREIERQLGLKRSTGRQ